MALLIIDVKKCTDGGKAIRVVLDGEYGVSTNFRDTPRGLRVHVFFMGVNRAPFTDVSQVYHELAHMLDQQFGGLYSAALKEEMNASYPNTNTNEFSKDLNGGSDGIRR